MNEIKRMGIAIINSIRMKQKDIGIAACLALHNVVLLLKLLHGSKMWVLRWEEECCGDVIDL